MNPMRRDRVVAGTAVLLVAATAALVVGTVLRAQRDGRQALEDLQEAQVEQLSRTLDSRLTSVLDAFSGIAAAPPPWTARLRDPGDLGRLDALQRLSSKARTGLFIVDAKGVITNGTLLRDPSLVGRPYPGAGLDRVLAGEAAILPVRPGVTTALPTLLVAYPLRDRRGAVVGAFVAEGEVSEESDFQAEVALLRRGRTGNFSFVDDTGTVVASSDPARLGRPMEQELLSGPGTGVRRVGDRIVVTRTLPATGWRTVFQQDVHEFEGALTGPLRNALLFVVVAAIVGATVSFATLARRLRRAREEQRRLEALAATREEFISIVSHELRTPVAGLMGFLQTTIDHWEVMTDDERRRAMGRGLASARRLHSLTRDVLDTSTLEAGSMHYAYTVVDLCDEVGAAVSAARDLGDRQIDVALPSGPIWVRADPDRIQQVLTNLLDNAVKASPPTAAISVAVTPHEESVSVSVHDDGPGLSAEEIDRVFDKFVRGRTSTTGTGLGLYICRQIVEAHGGRVGAESRGTGATFTVELPALTSPMPTVDA